MEFTRSGIENVAQTLKAIESLANNVASAGDQVKALSGRAQNLTSIRELSIQSSTGASQTASACSKMAGLAVELNRVVARFKV